MRQCERLVHMSWKPIEFVISYFLRWKRITAYALLLPLAFSKAASPSRSHKEAPIPGAFFWEDSRSNYKSKWCSALQKISCLLKIGTNIPSWMHQIFTQLWDQSSIWDYSSGRTQMISTTRDTEKSMQSSTTVCALFLRYQQYIDWLVLGGDFTL